MDFSLLLGLTGITGQLLMTRRPILGWALALINQPLWVAFAVLTEEHGLLLLTPGYLLAAAVNLRRACRERTTTAAAEVEQPA